MLTDRQLKDIEADVTLVLGTERIDPDMRQLARHARYLLDEVERLKGSEPPIDWPDVTGRIWAQLEREKPCDNCGTTGPHMCQARDE